MKAYLTVKGFLKAICQLITKEIERIQDMESMFSHDLSQGYVLKMYLQLLDSFLKNENIRHKFKKDHLMEKILHGFLVLRGVIVQKTQLVEESIQMLSNILDAVTSDSESDNKVFISACIKSLNQIASNSQDLVNRPEIQFIFERLTKIICPKQEEPTIFLILNKSPTQEEFIRGSMTKNPYPSTEIGGPLMRDVKNKICSTLGMPHLLEDDNSIELLVMNKIIKLDLSIKKVYQYVIKGTDFSQPMVITYRLQGLDGEATEEIVDHVVEEDQTKDPEEEFKLGAALAECNGLESVLQVVDSITDFEMQHHLAEVVLNFLWHLSLLKANRAQLVGLNGIQVLLSKLVLAFECETRPRLAELLLLTIENLVKEQNNMNVISHNIKIDTASQQMKLFLDKLSSHIMGENSSIFNTVSRILPFLCYGERPIIEILSNYFFKYLDFGEFDKNQKEENEDKTQELHLKCFRVLCENITRDTNGHLLKSIFVIQKITERLMGYLVEKFRDNTSNEEAWEKAIHLPSVPYVLGALSGLAAKHENTQKMFLEKKLIDCLHKLEKTTAVQSVGNYSENLLNNLLAADVPEVKQAVEDIRTQTQKAQMDKAKKHREKMLQKLNLKADPKNNNAKPAIPTGFNLDEVQDETGLTCMVCQEGYTFRPKEPLGFYTFSKMNLLELANTEQQKRSRPEHGFTTVTHFNLIHITCHQQAVAAEKHMKNRPKNEWEGAIIRNQHTNCNNLFPIQGPSTPIEVYQLGVDRYWSTLNSTVVRLETSQFRLLLHDMRFLLLYFAKEESLATHSHGGGKESNLKFIPFLVQMGLHLLDSPKKPTREDRTYWSSILVKYLEQEVESPISSDDVLFMLCLSIFIQTSEEWEDSKMKFLKRLIHFCRFYQGKENEKSGKEPPTVYEPTVARIRFGFIFMILVDRLHKIFKKASGQKASNTFQHAASEKWLIDMKAAITNDHLQAIDSMAKLLKEYESEILSLVDLQEFLDELGLLSAIYQEEKDESQFVLNILKADPPSVQSSKEEKE